MIEEGTLPAFEAARSEISRELDIELTPTQALQKLIAVFAEARLGRAS